MILDYLGGSNAITMVLIGGGSQSEGRKQEKRSRSHRKRDLKMQRAPEGGGRGHEPRVAASL